MKLTIISVILFICFVLGFKIIAQDQQLQKIDLILSIDEKIPSGSISNIKILAKLKQGGTKAIEADYNPGSLSLPKSDYILLTSESVDSVYLSFNYTEFCGDSRNDYNYNIDMKKGWLQNYFYVLYIYNTDKSRYKRVFYPLKGKHYTYEFDYPGGGMRMARKVKVDECK